jgi:hypothetical protein
MTVAKKKRKQTPVRPLVGWREWLGLPDLGLHAVKAKIDTGARTSSLHAVDLEIGAGDEHDWISFIVHPLQHHEEIEIRCRAPLLDQRRVTSSSGQREKRPVIATPVTLGPHAWTIEITLTSRTDMRFRMLLGRHALRQRFLVDPGRSYLIGHKPKKAK